MLFTQVLPRVLQALSCFERVEEYCNYSSQYTHEGDTCSDAESIAAGLPLKSMTINKVAELNAKPPMPGISLSGNSYRWTSDGPDVLKNIKVDIPRGAVTAIVGPVGSGKTTLLESMLGETLTISDSSSHRRIAPESMAYCSQKPWLADRTIRDVVVGEAAYDDWWYHTVKTACDLDVDIAHQPENDMTRIGNGLSGGQKQRIVSSHPLYQRNGSDETLQALARALYSRPSIVMLDDVFSGMDAGTVNVISNRLLGREGGLLRRQHTTVVLTTHNRKSIG